MKRLIVSTLILLLLLAGVVAQESQKELDTRIQWLKNNMVSTRMLAGNTKLKTKPGKEGLELRIPPEAPDPVVSVIKVEVKGIVPDLNAKND